MTTMFFALFAFPLLQVASAAAAPQQPGCAAPQPLTINNFTTTSGADSVPASFIIANPNTGGSPIYFCSGRLENGLCDPDGGYGLSDTDELFVTVQRQCGSQCVLPVIEGKLFVLMTRTDVQGGYAGRFRADPACVSRAGRRFL